MLNLCPHKGGVCCPNSNACCPANTRCAGTGNKYTCLKVNAQGKVAANTKKVGGGKKQKQNKGKGGSSKKTKGGKKGKKCNPKTDPACSSEDFSFSQLGIQSMVC